MISAAIELLLNDKTVATFLIGMMITTTLLIIATKFIEKGRW